MTETTTKEKLENHKYPLFMVKNGKIVKANNRDDVFHYKRQGYKISDDQFRRGGRKGIDTGRLKAYNNKMN